MQNTKELSAFGLSLPGGVILLIIKIAATSPILHEIRLSGNCLGWEDEAVITELAKISSLNQSI